MPGAFKLISAGRLGWGVEVRGVNINWKLASAFTTGAVLASGIVYYAVRTPETAPVKSQAVRAIAETPRRMASVQPSAPLPVPPPAPASAPAATPAPAATRHPARVPVPVPAPDHVRMPVREKPSPMPPPVRRHEEAVIARAEPAPGALSAPPAASAPAAPSNVQPPVPSPVAAPAPTPAPVPSPAPEQPAPQQVPVQNVSLPAPNIDARVPHTVTLTAGTLLPVRIGESLSSARNQPGDTFLATLTQPLVIDGWIIAERGARVEGRIVDSTQAGRVKGTSHLEISVVRLTTADGQKIRIRTEPYVKDPASSTATDVAKIGAGAAIGAVIGAIAGGGKGAAIGAGAGGAVGAGDVLLTRGKPAEIPVETRVSFKVQDSVTITERLD